MDVQRAQGAQSGSSADRVQLGLFLGKARKAIIDEWGRRVGAREGGEKPVLSGYVDTLLDRWHSAFTERDSRIAGSDVPVRELANVGPIQAVRELSALRDVVLDVCAASGAPLPVGATRILSRAVDDAIVALIEEVTRATEEVRREREERDRLLTNATHDVIWDLDLSTNELRWLGPMEVMFGYSPDTVGSTLDWWSQRVHPDDLQPVLSSMYKVLDAGEDRWSSEYRFRRADGEYARVFDRGCAARDATGKAYRMVGSMVDVTAPARLVEAMRQNEHRLRLALSASDVGIWDWTLPSGELTWDARSKELWGLSPNTEVSYELFLAGVHPEDRPNVDTAIKRALQPSGGGSYKLEFRVTGARGDLARWVLATGKVLFDETGRATRFIGSMVDVTDRHREAEFRERFLSILSHDLRQPLSVVNFSAAVLLHHPDLPASFSSPLQRIFRAGERMNRMIDDLLDLTRERQGGGIPIGPKPTDMHAVVRQAVEEIATVHPKHEVKLDVRGRGHGVWDRDRIAQALGNLVTNAVVHGAEDTPIEVEVCEQGPGIVIRVTNQGPPIPPDEMPNLFSAYRRGPQPSTGKMPPGLGLGLYIAHAIVRAHGGTIDATSSAERGTTFKVFLPRSPSAAAAKGPERRG